MSAIPAVAPSPAETRSPRRRLTVAPAPARRRRPRLVYGIVAVAGAFAIGAAQMSLSILTTQTSYELTSLTGTQRELTWQKQILADDVAGLGSPQYLAANAAALGMVINESPSYLRLSDNAVLGSGQAAPWASSVDAIGRGAVANSLITSTPLVTVPDATIEGVTPVVPDDLTTADPNTPPPITDGLPSPSTH